MLKVKKIESKSAKLKSTPLMDKNLIPRHGYSSAFIGKTGSGKTNLACYILTELMKGFYKPKNMYLFSPTANKDDMANQFNIPKGNRVTEGMIEKLETLIDHRENEILAAGGVEKTEEIMIVFDDATSNKKLNTSSVLTLLFSASRHYNIQVFYICHKYRHILRVNRLNCQNIFLFKSNNSETQALYEEQVDEYTKREFFNISRYCWDTPYSFIQINNHSQDQRIRKGLDEIIEFESKNEGFD